MSVLALALAAWLAGSPGIAAQEAAAKPAAVPVVQPDDLKTSQGLDKDAASAPAPSRNKQQAAPNDRRLPADSKTSQVVELPGRTLKFTATAGSIALQAKDGHVTAELAYISYQLDGAAAANRPVAFVFNGGPGSSSAWTHLIGFGPWRLPAEGAALSPSAPPELVPNAETWLDFTDLVFIDPAGTGFSQVSRGGDAQNAAQTLYSVDGDADSVAEMIALWLRKNDRLASPKLLVGESYSGIRAPRVLTKLQTDYGAGMSALVLISPVMDLGLYRGPRHRLSMFVNALPTIAAAAREAKGKPFKTRDEQADVEAYARGGYLSDLMRGPRDSAALDRIIARVSEISGLPEAVVRQYGGRFDEFTYVREANRSAQRNASGYDVTVTGADSDPTAYFPHWNDPFSDAMTAPVISAMLGLYAKLGWKTDLPYHLINSDVTGAWRWGNSNSGTESFTHLEAALALDPKLRVLVTHGATDLRTPYFGSVLLLEQLPAYADTPPGRVSLRLFPGGHMHYSREGSRKALRAAVQALVDPTAQP